MSNRNLTDSELLRAYLQSESNDSFDAIVREKYRFVFAICSRKLQNEALAQDAAQAVFITLAAKHEEINASCILSSWLYRTALFACENAGRIERRSRLKEAKAEEEMKREISYSSAPSSDIEAILDNAMATLSETDRAAILLRFADNLSISEIADTLRTSQPAASQRIKRAIEKLRRYFAKNGDALAVDAVSILLSEKLVGIDKLFDMNAALANIHSVIDGSVSAAHSILISKGVIHQMNIVKIKVAIATLCAASLIVCGSYGAMGYTPNSSNLVAIAPPKSVVPWPSKDKPSVQFLLDAWTKADSDLQSGIKGYQLDGTMNYYITESSSSTKTTDGKNVTVKVSSDVNGSPVMVTSWTWRQQNDDYYSSCRSKSFPPFSFDDVSWNEQHSYDGMSIYSLVNNGTESASVDITNDERERIADLARTEDWSISEQAWPVRKEGVYVSEFPYRQWIIAGSNVVKAVPSLLSSYERLQKNLVVTGPEILVGRACYALEAVDTPEYKLSVAEKESAERVYFSYVTPSTVLPIGNRRILPGIVGDAKNSTFLYTNFAEVGSRYILPTSWISYFGIPNPKDPHAIAARYTGALKWSRINDRFTQSDFQVKFPANVQVQQKL